MQISGASLRVRAERPKNKIPKLTNLVVVALLVGVGFAVVVVGNGETLRIFGISLLRAQVMPLHVEVIKVIGNMRFHLYSLQGNQCICTLIIDIYIQPP